MEYTRLGNSGLKVSRIAMGCMGFGDKSHFPWALDDAAAAPIFRHAVENGVNFWDTANVYSGGSSEEIVGRAIRELTRREDVVLATKLFFPMHAGPGGSGNSRAAVMENIDASLKRLGTDYIDLYIIHRHDYQTPIEETMEALHDVVKAGKARYIGASTMWAWQFAKYQAAARQHGWTRFVSMQSQYNLLHREEEREMYPLLADEGVGHTPWSPLAGGRVARAWGQTTAGRGAMDISFDNYGRKIVYEEDKGVVDAVQQIAKERGVSMAAVAMAWVLHNPRVTAPIVGPTKEKHLADAIAALPIKLTDEEVAALEQHYVRREHTYFE